MNKGIVCNQYGGVSDLSIAELPMPRCEKGQAVVKIKGVGLNPRDLAILEGKLKFLTGNKFPKLLGADFCGEITELPDYHSSAFQVGDQVMGYYESIKGGISAHYCQIPLEYLVLKPQGISTNTAASIGCTFLTAYQALVEKARLKSGQRVLIYGAAGGVGSAALQIAKHLGAEVSAVSHSRNADYCKEQGADHFLAYDREKVFESYQSYDVFLQVFSDHGNLYRKGKKLLNRNGKYISLIPNPLTNLLGQFKQPISAAVLVKSRPDQLLQILEWIQAGHLEVHIDAFYGFNNYLQAFNDLKSGTIKGKVLITFNQE